jgi:predicted dehydrogenase
LPAESMTIALVGCGAIARQHAQALKKMRSVNLVAVCDTDEKKVREMAEEWNIGGHYTSLDEMLERENPRIVSILTPVQTHARLAIEAVNRSANVLVEKPLTMSTKDSELILNALKNASVRLTVNYNWLLGRAMQKTLSAVESGKIGQILGIRIECLHTKEDPMASNEKHWCHELPGGRFGEMLSHPVYVAQALLGADLDVVKVLADKRGNYDWMRSDELSIILRGRSGVGTIYASFNAPEVSTVVDVYGTGKTLRIDLINQTCLEMRHRTLDKKDLALDSIRLSGQLLFQTMRNTCTYLLRDSGERAFQLAYGGLIDSITNEKPLSITPEMAYKTVRTVETICTQL